MKVIVVGGGIGGLTLASALARRGMQAVVIERAAAIAPVGAGLQLGPNAVRVLIALGFEAELKAASVAPLRAEVRDAATGRLLVMNRLGNDAVARWGAPYRVMSRAALQGMVLDRVQTEPEIELRLGAALSGLDQGDAGVIAALSDGSRIDGDVLVGCDGLHSVVQSALLRPAPPRFTGQTVWRGLAPMATTGEPLVQVWTGPQRHVVRYPLADGVVNLVAIAEAAEDDVEGWDAEGEGARLAATFADWPEAVRDTIAAVDRPWRSALYDRAPLPRWSLGRATLLGDAAHPMLPFLAQGAGMAIEDAWVLAARLAERDDPVKALQLYQQDRLARTAKVQGWSSRNARLFHLPSPAAAAVFGAAQVWDRLRGAEPEARFDWLYG